MIRIVIKEGRKKVPSVSFDIINKMIENAFQNAFNLKKIIHVHQLKQLFFRESSYDPGVFQDPPNTARGIAQITKTTAASLGWTNWEIEWMNPELSINYGTKMLDVLAKEFIDNGGIQVSQQTGVPAICILHLFYQYPAYRKTILKSILSGDDDRWEKLLSVEKGVFFPGQSI